MSSDGYWGTFKGFTDCENLFGFELGIDVQISGVDDHRTAYRHCRGPSVGESFEWQRQCGREGATVEFGLRSGTRQYCMFTWMREADQNANQKPPEYSHVFCWNFTYGDVSSPGEPIWTPHPGGSAGDPESEWGTGPEGGSLGNEHQAELTGDGIADLVRYHSNGHMYLYPGRGGVEANNAFWAPRDLGAWTGTVSIGL